MGLDVDFVLMHDIAKRMNGEIDTVKGLMKKIDGMIKELRGIWESPAAHKFEEEWQSVQPSLNELHEVFLPTFAGNIEIAATNYEEAERANQGVS